MLLEIKMILFSGFLHIFTTDTNKYEQEQPEKAVFRPSPKHRWDKQKCKTDNVSEVSATILINVLNPDLSGTSRHQTDYFSD